MPVGITHQNLDPQSFLALMREQIILPIAQDANYFSSATSGGAQGSFSLTSAVPGTSVFLSTEAAKPLYYARRPQITMTDASGSDLRVAVRITGKRFGRTVIQDIDAGATSGTAVAGSRVIDEITSVVVKSIMSPAASDTLVVGFDDSWLGLQYPIKSKNDIKMVYKIANGTPDAAGPKVSSDITAAMVNIQDAALDVKALYSATAIAVTDRYLLEYFVAPGSPQFVVRSGKRLG
jgi:hypothetical protein